MLKKSVSLSLKRKSKIAEIALFIFLIFFGSTGFTKKKPEQYASVFQSDFKFSLLLPKNWSISSEFPEDDTDVKKAKFLIVSTITSDLEKVDFDPTMSAQVKENSETVTLKVIRGLESKGVRNKVYLSGKEKIGNLTRYIYAEEFVNDKRLCWTTFNFCNDITISLNGCTAKGKSVDQKEIQANSRGELTIPKPIGMIFDGIRCGK